MTTLDTTAAGAIVPRYKTCKNETYTYSTKIQRKNTPDRKGKFTIYLSFYMWLLQRP